MDRQDLLKTLAEARRKTEWQIHAYGLFKQKTLRETKPQPPSNHARNSNSNLRFDKH
ncbi:MAG: hypothetical protein NTW03_19555 [Verrucomicrobia bacterium]|nr:hypothetical protein [Verrucomicrobiota bacterium]